VDDDPAAPRALARLLRSASYQSETFASAEDFLARSRFDAPGCILLDLLNGRTPGLNGLELQQALATADRQLPIVFVTGHGDIPMSVQAMKAGAVDFLLKPFNDEELLKIISQALNRSHPEQNERAELFEIRRLSTLTSGEHNVLCRLIAGQINKQIAADLGTVEKTIKVHRGRVMEKMGANSLAELVTMVVRIGIRVPGPRANMAADSRSSTCVKNIDGPQKPIPTDT